MRIFTKLLTVSVALAAAAPAAAQYYSNPYSGYGYAQPYGCYTAMIAGAGVRRGAVYGVSINRRY